MTHEVEVLLKNLLQHQPSLLRRPQQIFNLLYDQTEGERLRDLYILRTALEAGVAESLENERYSYALETKLSYYIYDTFGIDRTLARRTVRALARVENANRTKDAEGCVQDPALAHHLQRLEKNKFQATKLNIAEAGIWSIEGLQLWSCLEQFEADRNQIQSLHPLTPLKQLKHLSVAKNLITTVQPLNDLPELVYANIQANPVEDYDQLNANALLAVWQAETEHPSSFYHLIQRELRVRGIYVV
ncbi:hypothetical protein B0H94_11062 [Salsuginibacillus halophilus]|uniref:Leucine rich repeat (LRR) protein n=1 Tax=Salsuginibacillus halophilus TaxID=517424 RepID=A0A2P8HBJ7_9BACI|nr:leucine-rich repeat domain-containing protein [Salsuginibacillus halophilus]PSL43586.1 hypothetical protein B0H94_11062 [Salsuginibacillus halophilus]